MRSFRKDFAIGDRVAYAARFLRAIGDYSHDSASLRGSIVAIERLYTSHNMPRVISVQWDNVPHLGHILECNLVKANQNHLEPA